jgi:hypothetical protein
MSKEERRENDLPVSLTSLGAGKYRNFKFKDGKSPLDLKNQLERLGRSVGLNMNKGGMVKKKKPAVKKMMGGGMAKKSGYMYGGMAKKKKK